jgi:hypothetical protein
VPFQDSQSRYLGPRRWPASRESSGRETPRSGKVLFLAANPASAPHLALDEEVRAIDQKIRLSDGRDRLQLVAGWAVRADDLLQLLNQHRPAIVHFSGHGTPGGALMLVDDRGEATLFRCRRSMRLRSR